MTEPFTRNITDRNRELLKEAEMLAYKETAGGEQLPVYVFLPQSAPGGDRDRPAVLFFFSSAWDTGTVTQFAPQCIHLAGHGMVAMAFDYRVKSRHQSTPAEAMADARTAIRWVRGNAGHFGIGENKIVGAGGSGGAHVVSMAAMMAGERDLDDDLEGLSCRPDAMVLFSPILDISKKGFGMDLFADARAAKVASPLEWVRPGLPPTIIFHSTDDRRVPVAGSRRFAAAMRKKKNVCELVEFDGVDHSFFNFNVDSRLFDVTMGMTMEFLREARVMAPAVP